MDNEVAARATGGAFEELIDSTQLAIAGQSHGLRYTTCQQPGGGGGGAPA